MTSSSIGKAPASPPSHRDAPFVRPRASTVSAPVLRRGGGGSSSMTTASSGALCSQPEMRLSQSAQTVRRHSAQMQPIAAAANPHLAASLAYQPPPLEQQHHHHHHTHHHRHRQQQQQHAQHPPPLLQQQRERGEVRKGPPSTSLLPHATQTGGSRSGSVPSVLRAVDSSEDADQQLPTPPPERPWVLDAELQFHIRHCPCSCDHLGFGNSMDFQQTLPSHRSCSAHRPHRETSFNNAQQQQQQQQQPPLPPPVPPTPVARRSSGGPSSGIPDQPLHHHHQYQNQASKSPAQSQQQEPITVAGAAAAHAHAHSLQNGRAVRAAGGAQTPQQQRHATFAAHHPPQHHRHQARPQRHNAARHQHQHHHRGAELAAQMAPLPIAQLHMGTGAAPPATTATGYYDDYQLTPMDSCSCTSDSSGSSGGSSRSVRWSGATVRGPWCICLVICIVVATLAAGLGLPLALNPQMDATTFEERMQVVRRILKDAPLIDGHNDLPWNIRKFMHNRIGRMNLSTIALERPWSNSQWSHTDIPRLRDGLVGAQFWSAYVPCKTQHRDAVQLTLEQIDVIRRMVELNAQHLALVRTVAEIREVHRDGRIASLIGVEGGHALGNSLAILRTFYHLGARYLTLTHSCDTLWAQSSNTPPSEQVPGGLSGFGRSVIKEMNRLGMIIDLSHTAMQTAKAVLNVSQAPVIFSHSSAYSLCNSSRNVPDDVLKMVAHNGGVVMVNFFNYLVTCNATATVHDVIRHINHIRAVAGVQHVGLGAGYDGINMTPTGLEDVSKYPHLLVELLGDPSWSPEDVSLLAGQNLLRVFDAVETVRDKWKLAAVMPLEDQGPPPPAPHSDCSSIYS